MQLLCFLVAACLLALLMSCEGFSHDEPTRVALLKQTLVTTNEILTSIETKLDNLSTDTKKMLDALDKNFDTKFDALDNKIDTKIDNLSKDTKTMFEKLDKKLDRILANQIASSKNHTFMFHAHNIWLTVLTIVGVMLKIKR